MKKLYRFKTRIGFFYLVKFKNNYCSVFEDEPLDYRPTLQQALDELVHGSVWSNSSGISPSELSISDNLSDWERLAQ